MGRRADEIRSSSDNNTPEQTEMKGLEKAKWL